MAPGSAVSHPQTGHCCYHCAATCRARGEAGLRFLPGPLQLMILGDEVSWLAQCPQLLLPKSTPAFRAGLGLGSSLGPGPSPRNGPNFVMRSSWLWPRVCRGLIWTLLASPGRRLASGHSGAPAWGDCTRRSSWPWLWFCGQPLVSGSPPASLG